MDVLEQRDHKTKPDVLIELLLLQQWNVFLIALQYYTVHISRSKQTSRSRDGLAFLRHEIG
jgi:hypothetical protein